jgi:hypothetical protein
MKMEKEESLRGGAQGRGRGRGGYIYNYIKGLRNLLRKCSSHFLHFLHFLRLPIFQIYIIKKMLHHRKKKIKKTINKHSNNKTGLSATDRLVLAVGLLAVISLILLYLGHITGFTPCYISKKYFEQSIC